MAKKWQTFKNLHSLNKSTILQTSNKNQKNTQRLENKKRPPFSAIRQDTRPLLGSTSPHSLGNIQHGYPKNDAGLQVDSSVFNWSMVCMQTIPFVNFYIVFSMKNAFDRNMFQQDIKLLLSERHNCILSIISKHSDGKLTYKWWREISKSCRCCDSMW